MVRTLIQLMRTLDKMPEERTILMKLLYYDDVTGIVMIPGLKSKRANITILNDVSGVIKLGRITLLIGPPGCGKTTLLKALSGNLSKSLKAISIEGQKTTLQTNYILNILGLDICADTMFGDAMRRGISGGQKKRLTTGEMIVGPTKALFNRLVYYGIWRKSRFATIKWEVF